MKSFTYDRTLLHIFRCATLVSAGLLITSPVKATSIDAGKAKAASCSVCHGTNGIAQMPGAPNLAAQQSIYTIEQLKNYRSGKRSNEIMNVIAKPLTDEDIADLAVWFESIKPDPASR